MQRSHDGPPERRRRVGVVRKLMRTVHALGLFLVHMLSRDLSVIVANGRLFSGAVFVLVGLLSFASDRYCDGVVSSHNSCTRPATYYFYPWWAILLIMLGVTLLLVWWLRSKNRS